MTDLLIKASEITITAKKIKQHSDSDSYYGDITVQLGDTTGEIEISYDVNYIGYGKDDNYSWYTYDEAVINLTHFNLLIDDEECEDEQLLDEVKQVIELDIINTL